MYLNIFIYLYIQILMLDVMLSKWIMKMIEKNFCVIFDKIWNIYIFCEYQVFYYLSNIFKENSIFR